MPLELNRVHVFRKVPGEGLNMRLVKTNPAMRFGQGDLVAFLQGGVFWYEEEEGPIDPLPEWLIEEIGKADEKALKECGFDKETMAAIPEFGQSLTDEPKKRRRGTRKPTSEEEDTA